MTTTPPDQPQTFSDGVTTFQVILTEAGTLKVTLTGRANGRLLMLPESNVSVSLFSEKRLGIRTDNR